MKLLISARIWFIAAVLAALVPVANGVLAHEGREVGQYRFIVGWVEEPAYEGMMNGVQVQVVKLVEAHNDEEKGEDGHGASDNHDADQNHMDDDGDNHDADQSHDSDDGEDEDDHGGQSILPSAAPKVMASGLPQTGGADEEEPVPGLQDTLQVAITHPASGITKTLDLRAVANQPGRYIADLIPTAPGVYEFRVFGAIEGNPTDETFASQGGGGGFDDVQTTAALQFPHQVTGPREMESAVRGALDTARQAQDAALATDDDGAAGGILGIIGIVMGAVGLAAGTAGLLAATRQRRRTPG